MIANLLVLFLAGCIVGRVAYELAKHNVFGQRLGAIVRLGEAADRDR